MEIRVVFTNYTIQAKHIYALALTIFFVDRYIKIAFVALDFVIERIRRLEQTEKASVLTIGDYSLTYPAIHHFKKFIALVVPFPLSFQVQG